MAANTGLLSQRSKIQFQSTVNFQADLKTMLGWTDKDWELSEDRNSKVHTLCNSLKYWRGKLKPAVIDTSLIFTLFNESHFVNMDLIQLVIAAELVGEGIKVCGYSEFRNPRYVCLYFNSKEEKEFIQERFTMVGDAYVVYLAWALETDVRFLKVHWLPMAIDLEMIKTEVNKFADIVQEERKKLSLMDGRPLPSGKLVFKVKLKKGVSPESVPHVTTIADMEALITIQGREPLCLNCNQLGHVSKKCTFKYCNICKRLVLRDHACAPKNAKSYADAAKFSVVVDPDSQWDHPPIIGSNGSLPPGEIAKSSGQLASEIKNLENLIVMHEDLLQSELSTPRKRKAAVGVADSGSLSSDADSNSDDVSLVQDQASSLDVRSSIVGDVLAGEHLPLEFQGISSLTQSPILKKTYGRSLLKVGSSGKKASKLYDEIMADRESIFKDN